MKPLTNLLKNFLEFSGGHAALFLYLGIPKDGSVGSSGSGGETRAALLFWNAITRIPISLLTRPH